jgi:phage/plasmid-associated DNA primase
MIFDKKDLLTYESINELLSSLSPNVRARIIAKKLKKYCFFTNGFLYKYDSKLVVYKQIDELKDQELISMITDYLTESLSALKKEQREIIELKKGKELNKMCENSNIHKNLPQLMVELQEPNNKFGADYYQIHYKNGYLDLKTREFMPRIPNKHFVCNYINRKYKKSSKEQRDKVYEHINKIYPIKEDLEAILYIFGSALTGKATKEQKILFLLGVGSNGKSIIMNITMKAFEGYIETLEEEAFSMSNKSPDKTFSTFYGKPYIRIVWNNEPKADKMNATTFKKFVEGEMKGKLLFKNGTYNFNHNALPLFTANIMPNIDIDEGVKRRFRGYNHKSVFTSNKNEVDERKNIYFKDRDLLEKFETEKLYDAWVDILSKYACKWVNGEEIPCPESFQSATSEMMNANDKIQDFIDAKLELTNSNDKKDRIGKNEIVRLYKELYPTKNITTQQMISLLKTKVKWDKEIRCPLTGIKGCFYGVKERTKNIVDNAEAYDTIRDKDKVCNKTKQEEKYDELRSKNEDLEKEIAKLRKQLAEKEKEEKITKELEEIESDFDSDEDIEEIVRLGNEQRKREIKERDKQKMKVETKKQKKNKIMCESKSKQKKVNVKDYEVPETEMGIDDDDVEDFLKLL